MSQLVYNDGTDQYVMFHAVGIDNDGNQTILTGTHGGDTLPNAIVVISEYKKDDIPIDNPSVTWNATIGKWKVEIPASYITQYGAGELNISAPDMIPVTVEYMVAYTPDDVAYDLPTLNSINAALIAIKSITDLLTLPNISNQVSSALTTYKTSTKSDIVNAASPLLTTVQFNSDLTANANTIISSFPTPESILSARNSEIIDGEYTRIEKERIEAALNIGIRTRDPTTGQDTFLGIDGMTPRLVTESSPNRRLVISRNGD